MGYLYHRSYAAAELPFTHPPQLRHPNKQLAYDLAMAGRAPEGEITVTRWPALELPAEVPRPRPEELAVAGYYDYTSASSWHVNFADPNLFVAHGSGLLAQDELQCVEHPALGSIREALESEKLSTRTEEDEVGPTPILIANVERRFSLDTTAGLARPFGLYGNQFARADAATIRSALVVHSRPQHSSLIAIAAPVGSGRYTRAQIERVIMTAYTGFAATVMPGEYPVEICTGFWGCGAFGGNRELMVALQLFAARLASVARVKFYAFDDAGRADFTRGQAALDRALAGTTRVAEVIDRIDAAGYVWGVSNGT
ncbi:MAG: hypothetical protein ABJE66_21025 [Deltaproteobacteria bacterium]